jgi:hypothetical protein
MSREGTTIGDVAIHWRIILNFVLEKWREHMDRI